jgi:methionyl-tRNA formyltransferase
MGEKVAVVFFGSDPIALPLLELLWQAHAAEGGAIILSAIVTQPDRRSGRGQQLKPNAIAAWAMERGLTILKPAVPDADLVDWVSEHNCQLALVMAYGHLLKRPLREAFPLGMLNFHASVLPQLRGASPIESAIASGMDETGVSLMQIVAKMDAGPVADVEKVTIGPRMTGPDLRRELALATAVLWQRNAAAALKGELVFHPQDPAAASYCRKLEKADGQLDFKLPAKQLADQVRAYVDWPGSFFEVAGQRIKVGEAEALTVCDTAPCQLSAPATVLASKPFLDIATGDGMLRIKQLQKPGGRMLPAEDFLRGFELALGQLV